MECGSEPPVLCRLLRHQLGKLYADLFDWRQKGDYGDFFDFEEDEVVLLMEPTRVLIDAILKEIDKKI